MEIIKEKIQEQYTVFSRYAKVQTSTEYVHLLSNLAWYIIRQKIMSPRNAYDLSDFSFDANYAPIQSNTNSKPQ